MTVQRKPKDPTTGNGAGSPNGRNWCKQCGGVMACHANCPTKTGK